MIWKQEEAYTNGQGEARKTQQSLSERQKNAAQTAAAHGFVLEKATPIPDMAAVLYQMRYQKNGAQLAWLEYPQENKTFAITFKTLPEDHTGVFHILEHSVLCGSRKYPVKKPFVELIKSSLQTFLNALTFPDKTMYPLSSRSQQDFLNLMDVYLDAVLHPLCVEDDRIFKQEGWHYELDETKENLFCNGVVYNEMKGAYASVDTVLGEALNETLFPDNCYRFVSGGKPECIPDLTFDSYKEHYRKYYHPSNARIYLDGSMDLDVVLDRLDRALGEFEPLSMDMEIPMQKPVTSTDYTGYYETNQPGGGQAVVAGGWVAGTYEDVERLSACAVLAEVLCTSNEDPVKRAILEKNLAQNVEMSMEESMQQPYLSLVVRNADEERKEEIWETFTETLQRLDREGLSGERLEAAISKMEFAAREQDYGNWPKGLMNAMHAMDSWIYGGDPAKTLCKSAVFSSLREKVNTGYFEELLREVLLNNSHCSRILLLPSTKLAEEKYQKEREKFERIRQRWSRETLERIAGETKALRQWQAALDSPEQMAALPVLTLKDIPKEEEVCQEVFEVLGQRVLCHKLPTDGITHLVYYFSLADLTLEELQTVSFLRLLLGKLPAGAYGMQELEAKLAKIMGRFEVKMEILAERDQSDTCRPYLTVGISVLNEKLEEAGRLLGEVLYKSDFSDPSSVRQMLRQLGISLQQHIMMSGNSYAQKRVGAMFSAQGAAKEAAEGIGMFRWVRKTDGAFEQEGRDLAKKLEELCEKLFTAERAVLSVTGEISRERIEAFCSVLRHGEKPEVQEAVYPHSERMQEGILIPAETGFCAMGANLNALGYTYNGSLQVAAQLLSYGYLWNTVRVKGGAYGTGLSVSGTGDLTFSSYRDPSPAVTLSAFAGAAAALREQADDRDALEKGIISTIARVDPLLSAREKGRWETEYYLSGLSRERRREFRSRILNTTGEDLKQIADMLDVVCETAGACVIAGETVLKERDAFSSVEVM